MCRIDGKKVAVLRKSQKMSQRDLAKKSGLSQSSMEDTNTTWYDDDIKDMLEFYQIDPTEENVMKIATSEFVRDFHDRLVEYGNEMIADKVKEVFNV